MVATANTSVEYQTLAEVVSRCLLAFCCVTNGRKSKVVAEVVEADYVFLGLCVSPTGVSLNWSLLLLDKCRRRGR